MTRQLVTIAQAAQARPWATERYLRRLISERRIPFHKVAGGRGGRVLLDLADIDALAERGRVEVAPPLRSVAPAKPARRRSA